MAQNKADTMTRFTLVIPSELSKWLKAQAKHYNRSKNQHITYLLQSIRQTAEDNQERLSQIDEQSGDDHNESDR